MDSLPAASSFDKTFKPALGFSVGHGLASLLTAAILVYQLGQYDQQMGRWNTLIVVWMTNFVMSMLGLLSFLIGSWVAQSKTLWLLPPLPFRRCMYLGAAHAGLWLGIEALRSPQQQFPSYMGYFLLLPALIAAIAEQWKLRKYGKSSQELRDNKLQTLLAKASQGQSDQ